METSNEKKVKKTYEKPLLRVVSITAGSQNLGTGCKVTVETTGPMSPNLCISAVCFNTLGTS